MMMLYIVGNCDSYEWSMALAALTSYIKAGQPFVPWRIANQETQAIVMEAIALRAGDQRLGAFYT